MQFIRRVISSSEGTFAHHEWERPTGTCGGVGGDGICRSGQRFLPEVPRSSRFSQAKDIPVRRLPGGLDREAAEGDGGAASREEVEGGEEEEA